MALLRSLTTRRNKPSPELGNIHIGRAASQRQGRPVYRTQISPPVALLSSTNALSYDAPDISGTAPVGTSRDFSASSSTRNSHDDSDTSTLDIHSNTDASSIDNSPTSPEPEPNHLSCYFKSAQEPSSPTDSTFDAPAIPKRVPSHSKKAHERLHRKRSVQRMMSPPPPPSLVRNSADMFKPVEEATDNMFGNELAQLDEVVEEFSSAVRDAEFDDDAAFMESHGLARYDVDSYLREISTLSFEAFDSEVPVWI